MTQNSMAQLDPPKTQLLKWIGNKQRSAQVIVSTFPRRYGTYYEPFLGAGAVLATLAPSNAVASDCYPPLIEIWVGVKNDPETVVGWYQKRWDEFHSGDRRERYKTILDRFNASPNGPDLLFLCRSCYGGVIRFRKADGFMSTPIGPHDPISPVSFRRRVEEWAPRIQGCDFRVSDYRDVLAAAGDGDLVYCDPPYSHSQSILYGAQDFSFATLVDSIESAKQRGVVVALSIDGHKRGGQQPLEIPLPDGLFETEVLIDKGSSMLRRFQLHGRTSVGEGVADRLLLTSSK
jgi:DNA adenine methylase